MAAHIHTLIMHSSSCNTTPIACPAAAQTNDLIHKHGVNTILRPPARCRLEGDGQALAGPLRLNDRLAWRLEKCAMGRKDAGQYGTGHISCARKAAGTARWPLVGRKTRCTAWLQAESNQCNNKCQSNGLGLPTCGFTVAATNSEPNEGVFQTPKGGCRVSICLPYNL